MQTLKWQGELSPIEYETTIHDTGSIITDDILEGRNITRLYMKITPLQSEPVYLTIYKTNTNRTEKRKVEEFIVSNESYISFDGFSPYIIEINGSCDIQIKALRF